MADVCRRHIQMQFLSQKKSLYFFLFEFQMRFFYEAHLSFLCPACRTYDIARRCGEMWGPVLLNEPDCIWVFFFFFLLDLPVFFFVFDLYLNKCTLFIIWDIYLLWNMNVVEYLLSSSVVSQRHGSLRCGRDGSSHVWVYRHWSRPSGGDTAVASRRNPGL